MASYSVQIKPSAVKEIESLPKTDRRRVLTRVIALADQPRPPGCVKLSADEKYRIRQGRYRILYSIEDRDLLVQVVKVAHRREAYR